MAGWEKGMAISGLQKGSPHEWYSGQCYSFFFSFIYFFFFPRTTYLLLNPRRLFDLDRWNSTGILDQETALEEVAIKPGLSTSGFLWDCTARVNASSHALSGVLAQQYLFLSRSFAFPAKPPLLRRKLQLEKQQSETQFVGFCSGLFTLSQLTEPLHLHLWFCYPRA